MGKSPFLIFMLLIASACYSQTTVKRNADSVPFKSNAPSIITKDSATGKTFTALDSTVYPVYATPKGSWYIIRKSKDTGKEFKQYLKKVE
jgi:hypothetical protein